ncbi:MAG: acetolactate synthase small subunit [Spirochaetales bacterium]|nr:MAG: acetolactate synthase small subunit [Spirochaetales bacterium]
MKNETTTEATFNKHTLSLYVANKPGVLIRVSLVFARRGYNIDSLVVSPSADPDFSTMNIVASGDKKTLDQILKQLNKLVDVVHASDRTNDDVIHRELALIKIHCEPDMRGEILQLAKALDCDTVDLGENNVTIEAAGKTDKLDAVGRVFARYGVMEMIRTGKVLISRGGTITS